MPISKKSLMAFIEAQPDNAMFRVDDEGALFSYQGLQIVGCIPETEGESLGWPEEDEDVNE